MNKGLKIFLTALTIIQLGIIGYLFNPFSQEKSVYIDSVKLMNEYKGMQDARKAYQEKLKAWQSNVDTLGNEVQYMIVDYEKSMSGMSAKEKELTQKLIRNKQKEFQQYQEAVRAKASEADNEMTNAVLSEVNAFIAKYGKERGYQYIFASTTSGNIAYATEDNNVTDDLIKKLNENYISK